jgi:hypothetical protein
MRRFLKTQWVMVAVLFVGVLAWGGPAFLKQTGRRWMLCQDRMKLHAKQAAIYAARAKAFKGGRPNAAARLEKWAAFHSARSQQYRGALNRPWRFLPLSHSEEWEDP